MRKYIIFFTIFLMTALCTNAGGAKQDFNAIIKSSGIDTNSISISIKDLNTNDFVYGLNDKMYVHPASVQKILTLIPASEALGEDYNFTTSIYKRGVDSYVIKLGADPYLTSKDLRKLVDEIDIETVKKIYIDSSILERKDWGEGWQWDDGMNNLMPKFSAYNLDQNLIKITVMPSSDNLGTTVINPSKYPFAFINNVKIGKTNKVQAEYDYNISQNTVVLNGEVNHPVSIVFPMNNLRRYFEIKLTNTLADRKIYLKENYTDTIVCDSDEELLSVTHPLSKAQTDILKNSNNMSMEVVSKLAGGKIYGGEGTDLKGIKLFEDYCTKQKLDPSKIKLSDASGVSKNNLVNADFITDFLLINKDNKILEKLPSPGEGTLGQRMIMIKDYLKAKTGTLSDISSIAGFITTKKGERYVFAIIINTPSSSNSDKKSLEDYLIKEMYLKL